MPLEQPAKKAASLQTLTREAINLATQGLWEKAVTVNRSILEMAPNDVQAYNRLGKALMELGRYEEAKDALNTGLSISPTNTIAQKNLQKLSFLMQGDPAPPRIGQSRVVPQQFIKETGKTGVTPLLKVGKPEVLARLDAGDPIHLRIDGRNLIVESHSGEYVGQVEPKLAFRLISLMESGNRYDGAITSADENGATVILRETYQHPSQVGRVSFPSQITDKFRADVKQSIIRYELGEEDTYKGEEDTGGWEEPENDIDRMPEGITIISGDRELVDEGEEESTEEDA